MSRQLGFWSVFALVTGSQIGSGVFMLPTSLAPFGLLSLVGWGVSGLGAILLALVFAKLCSWYPQTGGPHVYVNATFGQTCAFFVGWMYWVISWISTPIVITTSIGYLIPLIGVQSPAMTLALEMGLLLLFTVINLKGVNAAGRLEFFLTLLKLVPLMLVPMMALFFFNSDHFTPVPSTNAFDITKMVGHVALLTLWGFIGLESATTPAGSIANPGRTIPRAVVLGTLCVAALYFLNSISIMGAIPGALLATSQAPYADVVQRLMGGNWHLVISIVAALVCIGTLNAWVLASGQIALGLAEDGLMPKLFAKRNRFGAPFCALLISSCGILPILFFTQDTDLAKQMNRILDFSVTAFLFVYLACCAAYLKQLYQRQEKRLLTWLVGVGGLVFCLWVISNSPLPSLLISALFVASGLPIFMYRRWYKHSFS